jgi:hypothetical protein
MNSQGEIPPELALENQLMPKDPFGTNWTTWDSLAQEIFGMGLIWTLLASFPATRYTKRDTMAKEEIEAQCSRASSNEHEVLLVGLPLCHFQNLKIENQRAAVPSRKSIRHRQVV